MSPKNAFRNHASSQGHPARLESNTKSIRAGFPLSRAVARDAWRSLRGGVGKRRSVVVGVTVAALGLPIVCAVLGRALAGPLEPILTRPELARAFLAGLVLTTFAAGLATGLVTPGVEALGAQIAVAPASASDRAVALLLAPVGLLTAFSLAVGVPLVAPLLAGSPGGAGALVGTGLVLWAALLCGGASGAATARSAGVRDRGSAALLMVAQAGILVGCVSAATRQVGGDPFGVVPALALLAAIAGALVAWGAAVSRFHAPARRRRRSREFPRARIATTAFAAFLLLVRRADVRICLGSAAVFGVLGLLVGVLVGADANSGLLLGTTGSALAAAPAALAVGGRLRDGAHVWALAPCRSAVVGGWVLASGVLLVGPALVVAVCAVLTTNVTGVTASVAVATTGVSWCVALAGGAIAPWRPTGFVQQAEAIGVYAVGMGAVMGVLAFVGPRLEALRLPPWLIVSAVVAVVGSAATASLARTMQTGDRCSS